MIETLLFISPHLLFQLTGIIPEQDEYHPGSGKYLRTVPGIDALFGPGGAPSWAIEQALAHEPFRARWNGLPDGVDFRAYVGSYDTDFQAEQLGWDQETKELVEEFMLKNVAYGDRYIRAVPPHEKISALPWPNYDNTHHFQIVKVAKEIGADLGSVLAYERSHKNRESVTGALEAEIGAGSEPDPADELVAA